MYSIKSKSTHINAIIYDIMLLLYMHHYKNRIVLQKFGEIMFMLNYLCMTFTKDKSGITLSIYYLVWKH